MMYLAKAVFFCCAAICWNAAAAAAPVEREEASVEALEERDLRKDNETSSMEAGPPDSHEAMNNRETIPKIREKRSYEFLMGLINNNSRYEVTRVDPSAAVTDKSEISIENKLAASELLLELMVKIASHPQQWEKVHKLLQKLDRDLTTSRSIVTRLQTNSDMPPPSHQDEKKIIRGTEGNASLATNNETSDRLEGRNNRAEGSNPQGLKWPTFDGKQPETRGKFINGSRDKAIDSKKSQTHTRTTYPKNFSYHRVTGKPIYLNKNPKAYVAVSVVAPKSSDESGEGEEIALEDELHRLKPWWTNVGIKSAPSPR